MRLKDVSIRNAKPKDKPYKLTDGGGLYLLVHPNGSRYWRFKYRFGGKEKLLALGVYPGVPLTDARGKREDARKQVRDGIDPGQHKKAVKAARTTAAQNSFEVVAREWLAKNKGGWAASHHDKILGRLENDIFPYLGDKPVSEISPKELLCAVQRIADRGALDTAHRALQNCRQVFRYAFDTERMDRDFSCIGRGALPPMKGRRAHFAAVTDPKQVGALLRALDGYQGTPTVCGALRLAPLVFVRPGELRRAEWADIDLDAAEWRFTVSKTKTPHIVPLATQAVAILRELAPLTGRGRYVFPHPRSGEQPMSDNAILAALRRMGIGKDEMTGHGFRAMARTILDEVLQFPPHIIEHQLAHAVRDPLGRAYNRTTHLSERRIMMQGWADYLDGLKTGACVIPLHPNAA